MKLTNKEKERILALHYSMPMNPYLFEHQIDVPKSDYSYSWNLGNNLVPTAQINPNSYDEQGMGTTEELVYPGSVEWDNEAIHEFLFWSSFVIGLIPLPVTQVIAGGLDLVNAGIYAAEGKYTDAGLYAILAVVPFALDRPLVTAGKYIDKLKYSNRIKGLGEKLTTREGLKELTHTEQRALSALLDNNFLSSSIKGYSEMAKQNLKSYLIKPNTFKNGYTLEKILIKYNLKEQEKIVNKIVLENFRDIATNTFKYLGFSGVYYGSEEAVRYIFDQYLKDIPKSSETTKPTNTIKNTTKDKIESLGYNYEEVIREFGGDINNPKDVEKLDKAWNDSSITSMIYENGKFVETSGYRPRITTKGKYHDQLGITEELPCKYHASKNIPLDNSKCWRILSNSKLKSKNINLPYDYKIKGSDYYYSEIGKNKWYLVTGEDNIKTLENVFSKF